MDIVDLGEPAGLLLLVLAAMLLHPMSLRLTGSGRLMRRR